MGKKKKKTSPLEMPLSYSTRKANGGEHLFLQQTPSLELLISPGTHTLGWQTVAGLQGPHTTQGSHERARCSRRWLRFHVQAALLEQRSSAASLEPCSQTFFSILLEKVWHWRKHHGAWVWVVQGPTRPFTSRCMVLGKKFIFEDAVSPHCKGKAYTGVPGIPP